MSSLVSNNNCMYHFPNEQVIKFIVGSEFVGLGEETSSKIADLVAKTFANQSLHAPAFVTNISLLVSDLKYNQNGDNGQNLQLSVNPDLIDEAFVTRLKGVLVFCTNPNNLLNRGGQDKGGRAVADEEKSGDGTDSGLVICNPSEELLMKFWCL